MKLVVLLLLSLAVPTALHAHRDSAAQGGVSVLAQARPDTVPESRKQRLIAADEEVRAAKAALAQAQAQVDAGKEPLPGERTGNVGGSSRLNEAYWARQAENKDAVAKAQARLDAAIAARNAALF